MELINATPMKAAVTLGVDAAAREMIVVAIKGTFDLPAPGQPVTVAHEQVPLTMADVFSAAPGYSAPVYEVDFAPRKACCDVLLVGSAHAPAGRLVASMDVGLRVAEMHKQMRVHGHRNWRSGLRGTSIGPAVPFASLPISYDVAFGGVDRSSADPAQHTAYAANPVGQGFLMPGSSVMDGLAMPNTEAPGEHVTAPTGRYRPMAFGPIGRNWQPRASFAGTYDDAWLEHDHPFLPRDFDERYFQAAPPDQQIAMPRGPVPVTLVGLTPDGRRQFELPHFEAPVCVFPRRGTCERHLAMLDTIVLEPDHDRFTLTWRFTRYLERDIFEIAQILIGRRQETWWMEREDGAMPGSLAAVSLDCLAED